MQRTTKYGTMELPAPKKKPQHGFSFFSPIYELGAAVYADIYAQPKKKPGDQKNIRAVSGFYCP